VKSRELRGDSLGFEVPSPLRQTGPSYTWGDTVPQKKPLEVAEQAWQAEENLSRLGEVSIFQSSIVLAQSDAIRPRDYAQQALPLPAESDLVNR
jgi:hypothetical protein